MPYELSKNGLCVQRSDTKEIIKCHDSHEQALAHLAALTINVTNKESSIMADQTLQEKDYNTAQREEMAKKGWAMADGSYPIADKGDLQDAIHAVGRGGASHASIKAHISKRAKALGATDMLPPDWSGSTREESNRAMYFSQLASLQESVLDDGEFMARGVTIIKPGFSKNADKQGRPRYYPPDVLKRDAPKFEGVRSYANHPRISDQKDLPERDIRDITGYFENVKASDDGTLKADYRVVGAARQWLWPMIQEAVSRKPDLVELSINALGETRLDKVDGKDAVVIESIVKGNSVDNVTTGAAGGSFAGALLASDPDQWTADLIEAMPFEQWRNAKPDYVEKLKTEWTTVRQTEALKEAQAAADKTKRELTALQEKYQAEQGELVQLRRAALADRILEASGLPFDLRKTVRAELVKLETESAMKESLDGTIKKFKITPKPPIPVDNGRGQPVQIVNAPVVKPINAAAKIFGLNESRMPRDGETAEEYRTRIQGLSE